MVCCLVDSFVRVFSVVLVALDLDLELLLVWSLLVFWLFVGKGEGGGMSRQVPTCERWYSFRD